jgi:hypothetical protein
LAPQQADRKFVLRDAGDMPARTGHAGHEARSERIGHLRENDGDRGRGGRNLERPDGRTGRREEEVRPKPDQLRGMCLHTLGAAACVTYLEADLAPFERDSNP